jgi:hypothetical protein
VNSNNVRPWVHLKSSFRKHRFDAKYATIGSLDFGKFEDSIRQTVSLSLTIADRTIFIWGYGVSGVLYIGKPLLYSGIIKTAGVGKTRTADCGLADR